MKTKHCTSSSTQWPNEHTIVQAESELPKFLVVFIHCLRGEWRCHWAAQRACLNCLGPNNWSATISDTTCIAAFQFASYNKRWYLFWYIASATSESKCLTYPVVTDSARTIEQDVKPPFLARCGKHKVRPFMRRQRVVTCSLAFIGKHPSAWKVWMAKAPSKCTRLDAVGRKQHCANCDLTACGETPRADYSFSTKKGGEGGGERMACARKGRGTGEAHLSALSP